MDKYFIKGGNPLFGCVEVPCAKNAYLPILAASVLCGGKVTLHDCPKFLDVENMLHILENFGASVMLKEKTLHLEMSNLKSFEIPSTLSQKTRSSIFCLGALLGRFKKARVAYPGGCDIGARPIDLHLKGLQALNVKILDRHGIITCDGRAMRGADVHLDFPSVGATENIMMAAACIKGTTKIHNAAKEPEVVDLQNFLNAAGAKIVGAGSDVITIKGVQSLGDVEYRPIPDRIISGTYLLAGVICGGEIILKNTNPAHIGALIAKLDKSTCKTYVHQNALIVKSNGRHNAISRVETLPYPAFPTDLQPQMVAMLATAKGSSLVIENLFETRFKYIQELCKMGADISVNGRSALIRGVPKLYGAEVYSNDLRGGAGLVLAGLMAEGYTKVDNIQQILRGYDNLAEDLSSLGADITVV